jgi:SAM-dependent methyltransferase
VSYTAIAYQLPRPLKRLILHFECMIEDAVRDFSAAVPHGNRILDAGAGEGQYKHYFQSHHYTGVDLAVGDATWNYQSLDAICDLNHLPFPAATFDAALNVVTLEHLRDPQLALSEMARTLKPGSAFLLVAPHEWEVHQSPHDYFRYTRHGLQLLLTRAGFNSIRITPAGGYFRLLARRFLNGLQFFTGGARWILFIPAAALLVPAAILLPLLEPMDRDKNFTLGYICLAKRSS